MKRTTATIILSFCLLAIMSVSSYAQEESTNMTFNEFLTQIKTIDKVEIVSPGSMIMPLLRSAISMSSTSDETKVDVIMGSITNAKNVTVIIYDKVDQRISKIINDRAKEILSDGHELILEAATAGRTTYVYGIVDEKGSSARNIVFFSPSDTAIVCSFGSMDISEVLKLSD